jgi:tripartite-type tricarboxylate transporter receptor subunit TctC
MQRQGLALTSICLAIFLFAPRLAPRAWTQAEPFYKGKTIRIMVGSTAGGFYDRWARLFARHMGKYIRVSRKSSLRTCRAQDRS